MSCKVKGKNIADCTTLSIDDLLIFIQKIPSETYVSVIQELEKKLQNLIDIGLQYLTLDRQTDTLSGGESQRIKMVKQLGNSLVDLLYIFDEPSIGLHPKDIDHIVDIIKKIRDKGNTVLIVEHDPDLIKIADLIIDMGPGSGKNGGKMMYQGTFNHLKNAKGKTASYFSKERVYNTNPRQGKGFLEIKNGQLHNLKNVSVKIPTGIMNVVTGVAGSGKSTLINKVLPLFYPQVTVVDQSVFTASSRSNLLTYLNLSNAVRKLFSNANKVSEKLFSRNGEGACPNCRGLGIEKIDLAFMDDIEQPCEVCNGSGYKPEVLKYQYQEKSIADIMNMTVLEALQFFPKSGFEQEFSLLIKLGLDYLTLGQRLDSFSGGERQRLKLTKELKHTDQIIVLDEPSTGLHPIDNEKLLSFFEELVNKGNTLIVIEHNLDIIAQADWIIDIGPGAGKLGGKIVFEGTVESLLSARSSATSIYLKKHLKGK